MERLKIIRTLSELDDLISYLQDKDFVSYDVETNGTEKESHVIGLSVCADVEEAFYVIISFWCPETKQLIDLETKSGVGRLLAVLLHKRLIMQNGPFDCFQTVNNFGVQLIESLHTDTMVLAHLLDENRPVGLKELGTSIFGEDSKKEQTEMKASVIKNGGQLTKDNYELYKADADLLALYGAKDALLTYKLFLHLVPILYEQGLDKFFYEEECMPQVRGPTYQLNSVGLRVDHIALQNLGTSLEAECLEAKAFIYQEITPLVKLEYPGTSKATTFNIGSGQQLAWLLHFKLGNDFSLLTEGGRELCHALDMKVPYTAAARREFVRIVEENYGRVYATGRYNPKTKKMAKPKKVKRPWCYIQCGAKTLPGKLADKYKWVDKFLEYAKNEKLLKTYVKGIQSRMRYNVIRPSFLQARVPSGRYASKNPNFQNLPARLKSGQRVKACIISRPGMSFVGADFSQIEPRVFASLSGDPRLMSSFARGEDFYAVVGTEVFGKHDCTLFKDGPDSFASKYPTLRALTKEFVLATVYGTTAPKMVGSFKDKAGVEKSIEEAQEIIDTYLEGFPSVHAFMLKTHEEVKKNGFVQSIYGRPRRIPEAKLIPGVYGKTAHARLPYEARGLLNLAVNFRCQSTAASIINRSAIRFLQLVKEAGIKDCHLVLNVHDELVVECRDEDTKDVADLLQYAMETTCQLPGVELQAQPIVAKNLRDLK